MTLYFLFENTLTLQPIGVFIIVMLIFIFQIRIGILINATAQIYHTGSTSIVIAYRTSFLRISIIGLLGLMSIIPFITCIPFLPILLTLPFVCIYQIIMIEKPHPLTAITRNWHFIQNSILRIMGLMVLLFILEQVLYAIPTSTFTYIWALAGSWEILTWIIVALGYVISLLLLSFSTIVFTILYFDLRIRRERYDLEFQAQQQFAHS